jgi:exopolysaccharide biosynthesis WecB/TagA/CpsF family protein/anti-anti-sigma factor
MNSPADFRTVVLLGVPFHDVTLQETVDEIARMIKLREPCYLATANLDFAAQASRDVELQRILVEAHLVICDGTPLVWASRWLGAPLRERIAGSDLVPRLAAEAAARGWRLFFLGGDGEALTLACSRLREKHPGLQVEGYSPPFGPLLELNHEDISARVRAFKPDILFVAFGCPKQEKWIYMHHASLGVPVAVGVGATVDFLAGKFRRAPRWMQVVGAEWIFRLMQEPRRLYQRYLIDLIFFVRSLRAQRKALQSGQATGTPEAIAAPAAVAQVDLVTWVGRAEASRIRNGELKIPAPSKPGCVIALDLSQVSFMDSTALGTLLAGFRAAAKMGGGLALVRPTLPVQQLLAAVKLDRLLTIVDRAEDAAAALGAAHGVTQRSASHELVLKLKGDLTFQRVPEHSKWLEEQWLAHPHARQLVIELSEVPFMDSSGLGFLLRAQRLAKGREGGACSLRGAGENLRNVIRLARVDSVLNCEGGTSPQGPHA